MWDPINSDNCRACQYNSSTKMICDQIEGPFLDKENLQPFNLMKSDELSLYDNGTIESYHNTSPSHCRRPLEEHDSNSQDSGYGASYHGEKFLSYSSPTKVATASFSSMCSMEDELFDFSDVEPLDKPRLPRDFNKLISNPIINLRKQQESGSKDATIMRPVFRRTVSLQNHYDNTPNSSRVRTNLFKGDLECRSFKRPEPPNDVEMGSVKRSKIIYDGCEASVPEARPPIKRTISATEESIMCAVQRSSTEPDLIGDFSKNFCLPLITSRHQDLKAITPHTLAELLKGKFRDTIESFKVIDCRYPYEFDGGHIEGALNIYTKEQCTELLTTTQEVSVEAQARSILVFHCEFSSERGPNLYRYLRKEDRNKNESVYPSLNYPEIYLLEGGYKKFFEHYSEMCVPVAYKEMLHPDHEDELRHFRQKSKTWNCDSRHRPGKSFKRLGM